MSLAANTPDRTTLCTYQIMQYTRRFPKLIFRMCRTPDHKRVVTAWIMYEDDNKTYSVKKGWKIPSTPLPRPYEIREVEGKGRGMYAVRDIAHGEVILREMPMILAPILIPRYADDPLAFCEGFLLQLIYWLEPVDSALFLSMHNCKPYKQCGILSGIYQTNTLSFELTTSKYWKRYAAIGRDLSFVNHSCSPNADRSQDYKTMTIELRACRRIRAGEEITIGYTVLLESRSTRRRELLEKYSFLCTCRTCTVSPSASDARRLLIRTTIESFETEFTKWQNTRPPDRKEELSRREIKHFTAVLRALEEEDLYGTNRSNVTQRLAFLHAYLGDTNGFKLYGATSLVLLKAQRHTKGIERWERYLTDLGTGSF